MRLKRSKPQTSTPVVQYETAQVRNSRSTVPALSRQATKYKTYEVILDSLDPVNDYSDDDDLDVSCRKGMFIKNVFRVWGYSKKTSSGLSPKTLNILLVRKPYISKVFVLKVLENGDQPQRRHFVSAPSSNLQAYFTDIHLFSTPLHHPKNRHLSHPPQQSQQKIKKKLESGKRIYCWKIQCCARRNVCLNFKSPLPNEPCAVISCNKFKPILKFNCMKSMFKKIKKLFISKSGWINCKHSPRVHLFYRFIDSESLEKFIQIEGAACYPSRTFEHWTERLRLAWCPWARLWLRGVGVRRRSGYGFSPRLS